MLDVFNSYSTPFIGDIGGCHVFSLEMAIHEAIELNKKHKLGHTTLVNYYLLTKKYYYDNLICIITKTTLRYQ